MADNTETAVDFNRMNPFGPGASADETRQAQQAQANDVPTDVNMNAVVARSQALTVDALGKGFASNQDRRDKIADLLLQNAKVT
jgi:hypothetical protein